MTPNPTTAITPFAPQGVEQAMSLAKTLSQSNLLPKHLFNRPADVLVTIIAGHELGLSPMQAIRSIHVVEGKPVLSADLMVALVQRSPICEWWRIVESNDQRAVYETKRRGNPEPVRMAFTIDQARAAGLGNKSNWKNYPAAMLRARCAAALARAVYPDLVLGVYEEGEGEDMAERAERMAQPQTSAPPPPARAQQPQPRVIEAEWAEAPAPPPADAKPEAPPAEAWDEPPPPPDDGVDRSVANHLARDMAGAADSKARRAVGVRVAEAHKRGQITDAERDELRGLFRDAEALANGNGANGTSATAP